MTPPFTIMKPFFKFSIYVCLNVDLIKLCQLAEVKDMYMKELQSIAMKHSLPGWEVPTDIMLETQPFSMENGLLTSTMKTNRPKLEMKYKTDMEELYNCLSTSAKHRYSHILGITALLKPTVSCDINIWIAGPWKSLYLRKLRRNSKQKKMLNLMNQTKVAATMSCLRSCSVS